MKRNPFKFGSIVKDPYFINRKDEIGEIKAVLNSDNHLILISPRRYGKSSLIFKTVPELNRPVIALDMQLIMSEQDLASMMLKRIYKTFPFEQIRQFVKHFRVLPTVSVNPLTNEVDVSFKASAEHQVLFEDVLNLFEKLSRNNNRLIVIFDEFQEIKKINSSLFNQFRSVMQHHQKVNYVFLGSQEAMLKEIFEKKQSPFYHFGWVMSLDKIPENEFLNYLSNHFNAFTEGGQTIAQQVLEITHSHPYYTQQLAYVVWEQARDNRKSKMLVENAVEEIIKIHDIDYERVWMTFNQSDKKMLIGLAFSDLSPLSTAFLTAFDLGASSTAFSCIKRLSETGYLTKVKSTYEIDDPFFRLWIRKRRNAL